jgi:LacI family transcriptional regulator
MGANDQIGFAALRALERAGLRVPDDIMVTGFNAFSFRNFSSPLLVSAASPAYRIGQRTGRILYDATEGNTVKSQHIVFPVRLVGGDSVTPRDQGSRVANAGA